MKKVRHRTFEEQEEIDAEKRALRVLLDTFHIEREEELEELLDSHYAQRRIGKIIAIRAAPTDKLKH